MTLPEQLSSFTNRSNCGGAAPNKGQELLRQLFDGRNNLTEVDNDEFEPTEKIRCYWSNLVARYSEKHGIFQQVD